MLAVVVVVVMMMEVAMGGIENIFDQQNINRYILRIHRYIVIFTASPIERGGVGFYCFAYDPLPVFLWFDESLIFWWVYLAVIF